MQAPKVQMMVTVRARRIAAALLLGSLGALGGCSREQQDWRAAERRDTPQAYGQFIEHHPESELVKQARTRIARLGEDRDWAQAQKTNTAAGYEQFLVQHPQGRWSPEAQIRAQSFSLAVAPARGTLAMPLGTPATSGEAGFTAASSKPAAASSSSSSASATGYGIQLGAFTSEERASTQWRALEGRYAEQLNGLAPQIVAADTASGRVFRLQAAAGDEARARLICDELRRSAQQCVPVVPH